MGKYKFSEKMELQICREYKAGLSLTRLAKKYLCGLSTVRNILVRHNIIRRTRSEAGSGKNNPMFGKKHSLETKAKMSKAQKGNKNHKDKKHTQKSKEKISKNRKGKAKGKNSGNWQGGKSFEPYGLDWTKELKERIRKRDNYRCQECFRHQSELKEKLSVHHIDFNKKNNNLYNLISLCRGCHIQTNYDRKQWTKYYQKRVKRLI